MRAPVLSPNTGEYGVTLMLDASLIADFPLFAGLDAEALDDILARAHARHYAKGTPVFSQNEEAHSFFLLLHGRLRVTQVTYGPRLRGPSWSEGIRCLQAIPCE